MSSSTGVQFDWDAMLMYGWVADRDFRVCSINRSLHDWMIAHGHETLCGAIDTNTLPLRSFIDTLLPEGRIALSSAENPEEANTLGANVHRELEDLAERIETGNLDELKRPLDHSHYSGMTILSRNVGGAPLAGVRVVRPDGFKLCGGHENDRVDLINVCILSQDPDSKAWKIAGFQGQLQEAWQRVEPIIREGTKSGTLALMGRSLSHNIGSHALYWLEQDTKNSNTRAFYRYLRERMELIAAFATSIPMGATAANLKTLVQEFRTNPVLLRRIARSEGVNRVVIKGGNHDLQIALPGGSVGAHAFYAVLENIIRDAAKYQRSDAGASKTLTIKLTNSAPRAYTADFIELSIQDDRDDQDPQGSYDDMTLALANLRISDDQAALVSGGWGLKERFIAAALLRGIRLEDIPLRRDADSPGGIVFSIGTYVPDNEPPILIVRLIGGRLRWFIYLMRPRDILLIQDASAPGSTGPPTDDSVTRHDFQWLRENIGKASAIRHRFVVIRPTGADEEDWIEKNRDMLPYRTLVYSSTGKANTKSFTTFHDSELAGKGLALSALYHLWLKRQLALRRKSMPLTFVRDLFETDSWHAKQLALDEGGECEWVGLTRTEFENAISNGSSERGSVLLDRHSRYASLQPFCLHYEPHEDWDPVRGIVDMFRHSHMTAEYACLLSRLLAAAAMRILLVDERLDIVSESREYKKGCSYKDLFSWKGIDIRGKEYSVEGQTLSDEPLREWLDSDPYDFVLLHRGIVDKIAQWKRKQLKREWNFQNECETLARHTGLLRLIIHSARMDMGGLPTGVKFLSLSNIARWLENNCSKLEIVDELLELRRI